jgi:hypothetical protein
MVHWATIILLAPMPKPVIALSGRYTPGSVLYLADIVKISMCPIGTVETSVIVPIEED